MLFDEKELNVLDNNESRTYFKEILQSYYSQNYRATIVLLYSFVIYDLFIKLQTMASEGDKKATTKLTEINAMIADDEKYSMVENAIIEFYKQICPLYFNRFVDDIEYLKKYYNIYLDIDDLEPLLETFMLDDLLHQNKIEEFKKIKEKLKYVCKIWEEYNNNVIWK